MGWDPNTLSDPTTWSQGMLPQPPDGAATAVCHNGDHDNRNSLAGGAMAPFPPFAPLPPLPPFPPPPPPWLIAEESSANAPGGSGLPDMGSLAAAAALQQLHTAQAIYALTWAGTFGAA